ncbi:hypothetical protein AC477_02150 [miscellaneous Crenarchaeota group-1 archaeon SG8-32-1]|uniref:Uncharacterized protein n=1 Tax=miscellaneous Crenarchaeota group-1 archaeon SG8-32-1 TaxID=1685124 RepID=A0A0M0BX06_9ARCH|nr:MAG: hypothetical protein AC477_02150 [miscellaneous Crenarchaeota group-1 archaeon SG8-32-1]
MHKHEIMLMGSFLKRLTKAKFTNLDKILYPDLGINKSKEPQVLLKKKEVEKLKSGLKKFNHCLIN